MSTIGVVVPVYNSEQYLHRCINSILNQTFSDFELVLVDDGSQDKSGEICDYYSCFHKNTHVIHQNNQGSAGARNTGIDYLRRKTNSLWLCFIDSDDLIHPQYLDILYSLVTSYKSKAAACDLSSKSINNSKITDYSKRTMIINAEYFFCQHSLNAVSPCAKIFSMDFFDSIRFPVGKLDEDEFVTYRLIFASKQIVYYDYPLYTYTENFESITHIKWIPQKMDYFEGVSEQMSFFQNNHYPNALHSSVWWYAHFLHKQMETIKEQSEYKKYRHKMRRMFQRHLLKYGKKHLPFHENYNYYEDAFPHIMTIYWNYKGIKSKFKDLP